MRNIVKDYKRLSAIISEMMGDENNFTFLYYLKMGWGQILIKYYIPF
jgi:hypothetical protein